MKTVCTCGFDYGDFVAHHQIPGGAKLNCPGCDIELLNACTPAAAEPLDANLPLRVESISASGAAPAT